VHAIQLWCGERSIDPGTFPADAGAWSATVNTAR
jgi:hypothetical protein